MEDNKIKKEFPDVGNKSLLLKATREEHLTMKSTLAHLKQAIDTAQSIEFPNRYYLLETYFDIIRDSHLDSVIKHRKTRITGLPYSVIKTNGNTDEKTSALFNQSWFDKFLNFTLDALFYGNSLVEMSKTKDGITSTLIPRENVIPEYRMIKYSPYNYQGDISYDAPIYSKNLIDINNEGDSRNLGELLAVSKLLLLKAEVMLNWSQHIEIYGQPLRVATTDSNDPAEIDAIFGYLRDLGRSGSMVKNSQTEIEFIESKTGSSSSSMYKDFEIFVNDEISKKILGGTMITDSGSSRSQSEVHLKGSYLYTKADIAFVESVINNQLIPTLQRLGMIAAKGVEFRFEEPEILTTEEKILIDQFLLDNFTIKDVDYFSKRYGTRLEFKTIEDVDNSTDKGIESPKQEV